MKNLKSIKLTQLDQVQLEERKMSYLVGGNEHGPCNCGCYYVNSGGSSTSDNDKSNDDRALTSYTCATCNCKSTVWDESTVSASAAAASVAGNA